MFEINRWYTFHILENGGEVIFADKIIAIEMPLIKLQRYDGKERIFNTASLIFISAELQSESERAAADFPDID